MLSFFCSVKKVTIYIKFIVYYCKIWVLIQFSEMKIFIRSIQKNDLPDLKLLEKKVYGSNFSSSGFETSKKPEDLFGYVAIKQGIRFFEFKKKNIIGFIKLSFVIDEVHVDSFGVEQFSRGISVGETLLIVAIKKAIEIGSNTCTLEVRESNFNAQNLYTKYGFAKTGVRKNYYNVNQENALIMTAENINSVEYSEFLSVQMNKVCLRYIPQIRSYYYKIPRIRIFLMRIISLFQ